MVSCILAKETTDAATLAEVVEARESRLQVRKIELQGFDGTTAAWIEPRIDPLTSKSYKLGYDRIILDPVTGLDIERHQWGVISGGWGNLMSFVYNLHYSLALGMTGVWILGICALIWTIDCFAGCYLTLPTSKKTGK